MCYLVGVRCVLDSQWNITEFLGKSGGEIYRRIRLTIFSGGVVISNLQRDASRVMDTTRSTCLERGLSTAKKPQSSRNVFLT